MGERMLIARGFASVFLLAGVVGACSAPPRPPAPVAKPEPPPPPPKSCDTIADGCVATADTRSPIQTSGWSLAPPPAWTYAHEADGLVAKTAAASFAVIVRETGDKKTAMAKRTAALEQATHKLGLGAPKKPPVWPAKPLKVVAVRDIKVALYQFEGFKQDDKPGALLVFTTDLPEKSSLLGVGFVLESDTSDADKAILTSVESLRPEPRAEAPDAGAPR
jgi:hypothetical protein